MAECQLRRLLLRPCEGGRIGSPGSAPADRFFISTQIISFRQPFRHLPALTHSKLNHQLRYSYNKLNQQFRFPIPTFSGLIVVNSPPITSQSSIWHLSITSQPAIWHLSISRQPSIWHTSSRCTLEWTLLDKWQGGTV